MSAPRLRPEGRRVLVLAYYFPPVGGGGVNRTLKAVRALASSGFDPWVVTVDVAAWARDEGGLAAVPHRTHVSRLPNPDWGRVATRAGATPSPGRGRGRLQRWLVPDLHVGWSALAASLAAGVALTGRVAALWSSGPPYSAHLAALAASRLGVPWVADFRDGWLDFPGRDTFPRWRRRIERRLERAVLARADRVLFSSEPSRARACERVASLAARSESIVTGFDPAEFAPAEGVRPPADCLALVHAGAAWLVDRAPNTRRLLDALAALRRRRPEARFELAFVGGEPELAREIRARRLGEHVRVEPALPRAELPVRLARAHRCVHVAPARAGGEAAVPGKLFDAAGAGRRLLSVGAPGAVSALAAQLDLGECFDPAQPDRLLAHLEALVASPRLRAVRPGPGAASALSAASGARRYVAAVECAIAARRSPAAREEEPCPTT